MDMLRIYYVIFFGFECEIFYLKKEGNKEGRGRIEGEKEGQFVSYCKENRKNGENIEIRKMK